MELAKSYLASEPKNALQVLDEAPSRQKQMLAVIVTRNWALMGLNNTKEARTNLDSALRLGRLPELVFQDGVLRLVEKDYVGARAAAEEVLAKNPEDVRAARLILDSLCGTEATAEGGRQAVSVGGGTAELGRLTAICWGNGR